MKFGSYSIFWEAVNGRYLLKFWFLINIVYLQTAVNLASCIQDDHLLVNIKVFYYLSVQKVLKNFKGSQKICKMYLLLFDIYWKSTIDEKCVKFLKVMCLWFDQIRGCDTKTAIYQHKSNQKAKRYAASACQPKRIRRMPWKQQFARIVPKWRNAKNITTKGHTCWENTYLG